MKKCSFVLLLVVMLGMVSANGLFIENNTISINKTNSIDINFYINITNQETFDFHNITSQNDILIFDSFDLLSGQTKQINIKISSNDIVNQQIRIVGEYFANLGTSSETEDVIISGDGVDICNFDLIEGDSINWINTLSGEVKLKNMDSSDYFYTVSGNSNYTYNFDSPLDLSYQVYKIGLPISSICYITINPEEGYVHSSKYDALIDLEVKIQYQQTSISTNFLTEEYTLDYNDKETDTFRITNIGSKIAKNITLSGEWFEFETNNFDLEIGESINIDYTLNPTIFETSQTNKTYEKNIIINGNFNTYEKNISVSINYDDISGTSDGLNFDFDSGLNYVLMFCQLYPDDCPTKIIWGNESDKEVTFIVNEQTYKESILEEDAYREEDRTNSNKQNERLLILENKTDKILSKLNGTSEEVSNLGEDTKIFTGTVTLILIVFLIMAILVVSMIILFNERAKIKIKNLFGKKEVYY